MCYQGNRRRQMYIAVFKRHLDRSTNRLGMGKC